MTINTAWDLEPFARDCGDAGRPFRWDEERRFLLRAEIDDGQGMPQVQYFARPGLAGGA